MNTKAAMATPRGGARTRLLDAAIFIIRRKGYAATSVEELCAFAGVTKGAFFYHFPSKDALALAAAEYWAEVSDALFSTAPYRQIEDPLERLLAYLDFRKALVRDDVPEFSCLVGTMVQEVYATHPEIRRACDASISDHAKSVEADITAAMKLYDLKVPWTAESLSLHIQAALQGSFILAKAKAGAAVVEESIDHLRRYVELLFRGAKRGRSQGRTSPRRGKKFSSQRPGQVADRQLSLGAFATG